MNAPTRLPVMQLTPSGMREIRMCWDVNGVKGHCPWYPRMEWKLLEMCSAVAMLDQQYGEGTHWLEMREA